jgi:hydrogenase nickel incorporation protein HypA/HybF
MHEFSIITHIIDIVLDSAISHDINEIKAVEIEVGQASGVVKEALNFAWDSAIRGTILENAALVIRLIPVKACCRKCQNIYFPQEPFDACPRCGEFNPEIITGRELRVIAIET